MDNNSLKNVFKVLIIEEKKKRKRKTLKHLAVIINFRKKSVLKGADFYKE